MRYNFHLLFLLAGLACAICACSGSATAPDSDAATAIQVGGPGSPAIDRAAIVAKADVMLFEDIVTVTDFVAERSAGGLHDYYSEGRYWWPDDENPDGPYVRRDGVSNPQNFSGHKQSLARFSELVTTLTAAYEISGEEKYAMRAIEHIRAWFINADTRMNPHMLYGQAIKGITTGRGIGIIDSLRLIDVALSIELLRKAGLLAGGDLAAAEAWFGEFGDWLTTHPYGDDEKNNNNNHSTWWGAQVAAYARVAERNDLLEIAKQQYRSQLPIQVATDGGLPDELGRTKPFHYLNYTLRAWATYAELLTTDEEDFWAYEFSTDLAPYSIEGAAPDSGRDGFVAHAGASEVGKTERPATISLADVMDYSLPYLDGSKTWPYPTELEKSIHPHKNDFLVFANWGLDDNRYLEVWKELEEDDGDDNHANLIVWQKLKAND